MEALLTRGTQVVETVVIRTLLYLKALDAIPTVGSISLADLATITTAQPALLQRLLRVVVSTGFVSQTETGEYAHTAASLPYTNGGSAFLEMIYDDHILPLSILPEYLEAKRAQHGLIEPGSEEDSITHNPFTWHARAEGSTPFEIMARDPARMLRLQKRMESAETIRPFTGIYDFAKLATPHDPERIVFVDVGGGHGVAITRMLDAHPEIRPEQCVLQDRPEVVDSAVTASGLPEAVQRMAHDFFTPQPVRHARAYHVRAVTHDYGDPHVVRLLQAIVPAMAADSKVLIADQVIPDHDASPLALYSDMAMLTTGGKERTEADFRRVLGEAGLKIDCIHKGSWSKNEFAVIEASLK